MKNKMKGISFGVLAAMIVGSATFALADAHKNGLIDVYDEKEKAFVAETLTDEQVANNFKCEPFYTPSDTNYSTQKSRSMSNVGNIESVWDNYKGDDVTIAIIDSGIDYMHPDFYFDSTDYSTCKILKDSRYYYTSGSRVLYKSVGVDRNTLGQQDEYDCLLHDWDSTYSEWEAHGSNVAGSAAAAANGVGTVGIAPNANILVLKIDFYFTSINAAINYCVSLGYVDVINMSLGAYAETFTDGYNEQQEGSSSTASAMTTAINNAYNAGIIVVAAAGNEKTDHYSYPACNNHVIGVGALAKNSGTSAATFSNYNYTTDTATGNHNVDVMAPGYVYAPNEGGTQSSPTHNAYCDTQGTSFASPIVAGAAALYKQKYPSSTPDDFERDLYESCVDIGSSGWDYKFGYGRLDVYNLLNLSRDVAGVSISQSSASLYSGTSVARYNKLQLTAEINPTNATNQNVTWSSSKTSVATVSSTGLVTAVGAGTATITVTTAEGGYTATCTVTVNPWVSVTSITAVDADGNTAGTVQRRKTLPLTITVSPSNATCQDYICLSSDETVATVTDLGVITGKSAGTATITVWAEDGDLQVTYTVTVENPNAGTGGTIFVNFYDSTTLTNTSATTGLSLATLNSKTTIDGVAGSPFTAYSGSSAYIGKSGGLCFGSSKNTGSATFTLDDAYEVESVTIVGTYYDTGSTFKVNNITGTGSLAAKGSTLESISTDLLFEGLDGATVLTVATTAKRATIYTMEIAYGDPTPAVNVEVTGVSINDHDGVDASSGSIVIEEGATEQLAAVIAPENATNKNVTWTTSDSSVATVSATGLVTGVSQGSATITVTTEDGSFTASANVTVTAPTVTDYVRINATAKVAIDATTTISAEASGTVEWSKADGTGSITLSNQSNTGVTITGVTAGSATVTATCGTETATCNVTVTDPSQASDDWTLVTDASTLEAGNVVTFACSTENAASGLLGANKYLASLSATFTDNVMECDDAAMFELGGSAGAWTLTSSEGTLGATAAKALTVDTGTTTWAISINSSTNNATVSSTNTSYGSISYNAGSPRFLNYSSTQTAIQLYTKSGSVIPDTPKTVSSVSVAPTTLALDVNGNGNATTGTLAATVSVTGKTGTVDETVTWSTGNASIATVDQTGKVTAVSAGTTTITATSNADSEKFGSCAVTVTANTRTLTSIEITTNPTKTRYEVGETFDPTGAVVTAHYDYAPLTEVVTSSVTWTPTATLTTSDTKAYASYTEGGITKTANVTIKVTDPSATVVGYQLISSIDDFEAGDYVIAAATSSGYDGFLKTLAASSNNSAVTVTDDVISNDNAQNFVLTFTAVTGGYTISNESGKYLVSTTNTSFSTTSTASSASVFTVTCSSSGTFRIICSTQGRGIVYRSGYGFKNYATSNYSSTGYSEISLFKYVGGSVTPPTPIPLTGITLNKTSLTLDINATETLVASFQPENADDKTVTWYTMDSAIATIDQTGKVTAVAAGTTTIYVMSNADATIFAECTVTVNETVTPPVSEDTEVVMSTFESITGYVNGDTNVSYEAQKGTAANDPVVNSGEIRVYQNGGIFKVTANNGKKITSIILGSSMATTVKYSVDGGTEVTNQAISAGGTLTVSSLSADEVIFTCTGTSKTARLYVNYLKVTYASPDVDTTDLDNAIAWATAFNEAITCNGGVTAPSTSAWATCSTSYASLTDAAKTYIVSAEYTVSVDGSTVNPVNSTNATIASAVAKYDYIVAKYGTTSYANFIGRTISSSNNIGLINNKISAGALLAISIIGMLSITGLALIIVKRKKIITK